MKASSSPYIRVSSSGIHASGIFAACDIKKGTKIIEYIGEKVTKAESDKRADAVLEAAKKDPSKGGVYIFILNKRYDIDGNVPYNTARLINHSCEPNCESLNDRGHIWVLAKRDVKAGEELTYDYGYDLDDFKEHPCRCGAKDCIGFIVAKRHRKRLLALLSKESIKASS